MSELGIGLGKKKRKEKKKNLSFPDNRGRAHNLNSTIVDSVKRGCTVERHKNLV